MYEYRSLEKDFQRGYQEIIFKTERHVEAKWYWQKLIKVHNGTYEVKINGC